MLYQKYLACSLLISLGFPIFGRVSHPYPRPQLPTAAHKPEGFYVWSACHRSGDCIFQSPADSDEMPHQTTRMLTSWVIVLEWGKGGHDEPVGSVGSGPSNE